jgi:hypothetical protein
MLTKMLRVAVFAVALASPAVVLAQSTPPTQNYSGPNMMWGGPGMMWNGRGMMWGGQPGALGYGMMRGCPMMGAMMNGGNYQGSASAWLDGQLAYAHSELAITPAQETAWKDYAAAVRDRSAQMWSPHQSMMGAMWQDDDVPFDQAYDLHIQVMQAHLDAMKTTREASLKLYSALSPDQRKKASWVLPQSMCMM